MSKYEEDLNTIEMTMLNQCNKEYKDIKHRFISIKELVDKETPKKVINDDVAGFACPNCKNIKFSSKHNYCSYCGQRLDWSAEDEQRVRSVGK